MPQPSQSAIPGALPALLQIATSALPAGTTVFFGPAEQAFTAPLTFIVSEIVGDQKPAELGVTYKREEVFNFVCSLVAWQGEVPGTGSVADFTPMLTSLMANFALVSKAIANNPWLSPDGTQTNGTVRFAEVGNFHITPDTDINAISAITLDFSVRCSQRVTSLT